jgi:hypothetical protein
MSAEEKIALCHAGLIKLTSFAKHIKFLRAFKQRGYDIDRLIQDQRKGGPEFFSSQIIVQENLSGSGTYDLRNFHGLSEPRDYRNVTAWDCRAEDFPIVYFIGFRVPRHFDILQTGPDWRGPNAIRSIETAGVRRPSRRRGGVAARGARAAGVQPAAAYWHPHAVRPR